MIYLDNSATTQPCDAAIFAALEMLKSQWQNPSALYGEAVRVEKRIAAARVAVSAPVGAMAREVIFTGSGTEANSLAILGAAARFRGPRRVLLFTGEHPAVTQTAPQLEAMGHSVSFIPATPEGLLDVGALDTLLGDDVALLSCMQVSNETGAVQPLREVSARLKAASPAALLHVDGVQGYMRLPIAMADAGIDLYTASAHKLHGPKGIGALIARKGVKLEARVKGGGQEGGLRSGTENTAGIAAFEAAVAWAAEEAQVPERLRAMKLRLHGLLAEAIEGLRVNGPSPETDEAAPHILNVSLPGVGGEVMVHALEQEGVLVGTGAACSSKKREMSPTFAAMGVPRWAAESALRFSLGLMNTMEEVERAAQAVIACYGRYKAFQRR